MIDLDGAPGEVRTPDLTLRSYQVYPSMDGLKSVQLLQANDLAEMADSDPSMHTTGRAIQSVVRKSEACHKSHHIEGPPVNKKKRINRQHRRRAKAKMRNPAAVRAHDRPRPNGKKVRVRHS